LKRSEALGLITAKMNEWYNSIGSDNEIPDWFMANELLKSLEATGMLPPYRTRTEEEKEYFNAINQYEYCHQWEREE
jgi:hypothetical protein